MLIHFNARPVLVFDGAGLPMKADTHSERRARRENALAKAEEALAVNDLRKAREWYQRAYTVTSEMARNVIRECRKLNIEYVVAPYEADAQLAWMIRTGYIDSVITEDSDLMVYGASKIFYKMNKDGMGDMFESKNLTALETISLTNFTEDMFIYMCVCSGCDFFKGVHGLGIKKAHGLVKRYRTLSQIIRTIQRQPRYKVSSTFAIDFCRACMVFRHQTVYDMNQKRHVYLRELDASKRAIFPKGVLQEGDDGSIDLSFLGVHREPELARRVAEGLVHPYSLQDYEEPLDIVSRPITTAITQLRKSPSPTPKRKRPIPKQLTPTRGFQVQPILNRPRAQTTAALSFRQRILNMPRAQTPGALSLRQRLEIRSTGPLSFNPRRIGLSLNAQKRRRFATPAVWSSFRKKSPLEGGTSSDVNQREDSMPSSTGDQNDPPHDTSDAREKKEDSGSNRDATDEVELAVAITPEPEIQDYLSAVNELIRPNRPQSSSVRVEAVNTVLGRFAKSKQPSAADKFKPLNKHQAPSPTAPDGEIREKSLKLADTMLSLTGPPSPDSETYKLFESIDPELSREEDQFERNGKVHCTTESKRPNNKAEVSSRQAQITLSRFFKPNIGDEKCIELPKKSA